LEGLNCSALTTDKQAAAKHCVLPDQIIRAALGRKEDFASELLAFLIANKVCNPNPYPYSYPFPVPYP
jgi:hypothetical protein